MTDVEARNELEAQILAAQEGRITSDDLLKTLLNSQVFMPVQDEKAPVLNVQRSTRVRPFLDNYPGFAGGILESFKWVLENMGSGYGIMLNPDSELGFDMEPETVQGLIQQLTSGGIKH